MATRTVTQKNAFGGRLLSSAKGILVGLAMVFICSILLVCNEQNSVNEIRAIKEFSKKSIAVSDARALSENDGKPVALQGGALSFTPVSDNTYGITSPSFHLKRVVELYQRHEEKSGTSTDKEVTYTYSDGWYSTRIDSSKFNTLSERDANAKVPTGPQYEAGSIVSNDVKLGDFVLTDVQASQLPADTPLPVTGTSAAGFKIDRGYIINADQNPAQPKIGDVKISYFVSTAATASALGQQSGTSLAAYKAKNGKEINRLYPGILSAPQMVEKLEAENKAITWLFRIILCVLICAGFSMLFAPVQVLVSMVPLLGKFLNGLTGKVAGFIGGIIGIALSILIIAISWIAVRPIIGIPLLIVVVALVVLAVKKGKNREQAVTEAI